MQGVAGDILSLDYSAVGASTSIEDAEKLLLQSGADEVYVLDPAGVLIGVLPGYALLKRRLLPDGSSRVAEIMSSRFPMAQPDTPLMELAARLREHVHGRIVIVDRGRIAGIVYRRDVLARLVAQSSDDLDAARDGDSLAARHELQRPYYLQGRAAITSPSATPSPASELSSL